MAEGSDDGGLGEICVDGVDASQFVEPVTVHGAGAANALSARSAERE